MQGLEQLSRGAQADCRNVDVSKQEISSGSMWEHPWPAVLAAGVVWLSSRPGKLPWRMSLALLPEGRVCPGDAEPWQAAVAAPALTQLSLQLHRPLRRC